MTDSAASQQESGGASQQESGGRGRGRVGGRGRGRGGKGRGGRGPNRDDPKDNKSSGNGANAKAGGGSEANSKNDGAKSGDQGGGGKNRRRNNQSKNKKGEKPPPHNQQQKKDSAAPRITEDEKQRLEEERILKAAQEEERKRLEEEENALKARLEARKAAQKALDTKYREALDYLKDVIESVKLHVESRKEFSPEELVATRQAFEISKKSLKSDLKKCTTFVKKIKTGGAWSMKPNDVVRDVSTLNLSRYVEEVVAAILEAQLKLTDIPVALALCKAMHQRYSTFLPALLSGLWSVIHSKPTEETGKLRRVYVRLITEFLLNGLTTETKQVVKLITEVTGGKDGSYNVTDAHIVLAFVKSAGFEILDTTPSSVRSNTQFVEEEVLKVDKQPEGENEEASDPNAPVHILKEAAETGTSTVKELNLLLKQRAVCSDVSKVLYDHCKGAYATLSKSLISTDSKLKKMEKRCEQDRLLAGTLAEPREKGLQDARKLRETLWKSIEVMSDTLDLPMPQLKEEKDEEAEGGTGVEVWTKSGGDEDGADFGPFDDEETRVFYCDIPDLLTTVPPALLGLSEDEIEKRKAENFVKYGSEYDSVPDQAFAETDEVAPSSEAELEAAEQEEGKDTGGAEQGDSKDENKDNPHYKLMVLLEQELPECNRREKIDELSEKFCTNHATSKNSRKRLSQTLFHVPRTRLDLLPYYSRMASILSRVWSDIGESLVMELEQQFHGQAKFKKNQNIESRLRTARYVGELTKFRLAPPIVALRCLKRCLEDFSGGNVDVSCSLLESCGRYLYRLPHTKDKLENLMETMVRLSKAKVGGSKRHDSPH
jgi:regulator of nonsense transcripts 2